MKLSSVSSLWLFFTEAVSESFWKWCGEHSSKGKGSSTRRSLTVEHWRWVWCVGATVGVKIRLHAFEAYRLRIWVWCVSGYPENKWEHTNKSYRHWGAMRVSGGGWKLLMGVLLWKKASSSRGSPFCSRKAKHFVNRTLTRYPYSSGNWGTDLERNWVHPAFW